MPRPELYFFLLPFTIISLLLYYSVLREIIRRNGIYSSIFYKLTLSLAIYDFSYVIVYFIFEIPQDWPGMYAFFYTMNGTIFPQLQYAHKWLCFLAQFYGVTLMSLSRMLQLCYPSSTLTRMHTSISTLAIIIIHAVPPLAYALYVVVFQQWRRYEYDPDAGMITRIGDAWSIEFNSNVMIGTSTTGAAISALCYARIFVFLRNRPYRLWRNEVSVMFTSFILFIALCAMCAYYIINKYSLLAENWGLFYTNRNLLYISSFFMALINPWCLLITSKRIRKAVLAPLPRVILASVRFSGTETSNVTAVGAQQPRGTQATFTI